jgi:hypothetical protein
MPITAPPTADYSFIFRRVAKFLGIANPNDPEGDTVLETAPYTQDMVKQQIIQSEYEVNCLIASVEGHPYRNQFFTQEPDPLANGSTIPGYIGIHGGVKVETSKFSNVFEPGRLAGSFDQMQRVRNNFKFYGEPYDLYFIDNGVIHLGASNRAKVYVPTIPVADSSQNAPPLATPKLYANGVIGHAVMTLRIVGSDAQHRLDWANIWAGYVQLIMDKKASLPPPEQMQRIAR